MKSTRTIIGLFATTIALSQVAWGTEHENRDKLNASGKPVGSQSQHQMTTFQGKIMSLREYLSGSAGEPSSSWSTGTNQIKNLSQTSRDTQDQNRSGEQTTTTQIDRNSAGVPRSTTTASESYGTGSMNDEPMVLVVKAHGASYGAQHAAQNRETSLAGSPSANSPRNAASSSTTTTSPSQPVQYSSAFNGEVYILLVNSSDAASRTAFSKAQSYRQQPSALTNPQADKLLVRGTDDSSTTTRPNRNDTERSDIGGSAAGDTRERSDVSVRDSNHARMETKLVKINGRVLTRGILQAIEVSSVQDADKNPAEVSTPSDK